MVDDKTEIAVLNYRTERTIAIVGAVLMISKFLAYLLTGSVSILTDALESIVNVVAGAIGVYALWLCLRPADRDHPYGHGKMELLSSSVEGMMILVAGMLIIVESVDRFMNPGEIRQIDIGLAIVVIAAVVNFAMGSNAIRRGRKVGSMALEASGKHLCSDTYSSVGIIIGLALIYVADFFGYDAWWLDPLTAMLFGFFILFTGIGVVRKSTNGIIDAADTKILVEVTRAFNHVRTEEIIDIHHLRVIRYGSLVHVEAHMVVPDDTTQRRVDEIRGLVTAEIMRVIGSDADVTIQAESCDYLSCLHCKDASCEHRDAPFRSNVVFNLDTVTSEQSVSQKKWPLKSDEPQHASVRKK